MAALSQFKNLGKRLPLPESSISPPGVASNADQEPIKKEDRTYNTKTFFMYWISDLVNVGSWQTSASFVALGLSWWESILAVLLGSILISILIVLNGIIGARLHTPFAVTARAPFGYNLARFAVISRMLLAWFWFSINTFQGGSGVRQMLIALSPSFANFPNSLPLSAGVTSSEMLCFFLFWLIQFPFCLIHPKDLKNLFLAKAILVPATALGMMIWCIVTAGDGASTALLQPSKLSGLAGYLSFFTAVTSAMGTWSTMSLNIGDFARYSKKESSATLQLAFVPLLFTTTAIFGAVSASCTEVIYGELLWNPFELIARWQGTPGGRAAAFFAASIWAFGNIGTNITANSISSATDLSALFPRYINIFRGQLFAVFVGCWAFAPWKVLSSAGSFISFMASYSVVLCPLSTIMAVDFFLVKKGRYDVVALYDPQGIYLYKYGVNWRAVVALVVSVTPNLPGMAASLSPGLDIGNLKHLYAIANIYGCITAASFFILLSKYFPDHQSLAPELILADDVLAGKVAGYEHRATGIKEIPTQSDSEKMSRTESETSGSK